MNKFKSRYNNVKLPGDFISELYESVELNNVLYVYRSVNQYFKTSGCFCCKIDVSYDDYLKSIEEFEGLYNDIEKISKVYNHLSGDPVNDDKILKPLGLLDRYRKYISKIEVEFSEDDGAERFRGLIEEEAEKRIGNGKWAVDVCEHSRNLCALMYKNAQKDEIDDCASLLAEAFFVHKYAESDMKKVSCRIAREIVCKMDLTDDAIDDFYRPKRSNSRKSLAPLFVYIILKEKSNRDNPMKQNDILKLLIEDPYEIDIKRKALGRIIHNLVDSRIGIHTAVNKGTWFENE